jgi:hypothetical protein
MLILVGLIQQGNQKFYQCNFLLLINCWYSNWLLLFNLLMPPSFYPIFLIIKLLEFHRL